MKKVLITGITGQDGSYLAEKLLAAGCEIHGIVRRSSQHNRQRIDPLREKYPTALFLHYSDLGDPTTLRRLITQISPDRIFHLAGQSHVGLSFEIPESTMSEVTMATLSLLEICRDMAKPPRIYLAGSSEVFGAPESSPQTEDTAHRPTSPYGCAKSCAVQLAGVYRDAFGLFVSTGISYNHESVRRGPNFVTRKITATACRIARGSDEVLELGNLDSERDWGYAPEYVNAMIRILEYSDPMDFVLATGIKATVRSFALAAFVAAGLDVEFSGAGENEVGKLPDGRLVIKVNTRYFRPVEPQRLVGDARKIEKLLGWKPTVVGSAVAEKMVQEEFKISGSEPAS